MASIGAIRFIQSKIAEIQEYGQRCKENCRAKLKTMRKILVDNFKDGYENPGPKTATFTITIEVIAIRYAPIEWIAILILGVVAIAVVSRMWRNGCEDRLRILEIQEEQFSTP
jgi:hypothetical protein